MKLPRKSSHGRLRVGLIAAALSVWPAALAGAGDESPSDTDVTRAYLAAVGRWSAGDDAVVETWADWIAGELTELRGKLPRLVVSAAPGAALDAVKLHVLAAHAAAQRQRHDLWRAHFDLAEALLKESAAAPAGPRPPDFGLLQRDVSLARGYGLLVRWQPSFALDAFKRALEARPDDGDALLGAGMAEELRVTVPALALDRYVSSPELLNRGAVDDLIPAPRVRQMDHENSQRAAETYLRRAASSDAALAAEARLRLGHVLDGAGRRAPAEREWTAALEQAQGALACLAHMFLGRAAERRRDWREAGEHYRSALRESPGAQSAHLALAAALERQGDIAGAREHVRAALHAGGERPVDPWLRYHFEPQRGLRAVLERLARRTS